jgi:hypothetical protein
MAFSNLARIIDSEKIFQRINSHMLNMQLSLISVNFYIYLSIKINVYYGKNKTKFQDTTRVTVNNHINYSMIWPSHYTFS